MSVSVSRRQHLRFDTAIPARIDGAQVNHYATNISFGGVFIRMENPPDLRTRVNIELFPSGNHNPIAVSGSVVFVVRPEHASWEGSESGVGVAFDPLEPVAQQLLAQLMRQFAYHHAGRVLIIDNDVPHNKVLAGMFHQHRYDVVTVGSAYKALDMLPREPYDFILTAVTMPEMGGLKFRELVCEEHQYAESVPFVFLSSTPGEEDPERAISLGVKSYVRKPVDEKRFAALLGELKGTPKDEAPAIVQARAMEEAYKRLVFLGVDAQLTAEKRTIGKLFLQGSRIKDEFSGKVVDVVTVLNEGSHQVRIVEPPVLRMLPPIPIDALTSKDALQRAIEAMYENHRAIQGNTTALLAKLGISPEFDKENFRVHGRVQVGEDEATFFFKDNRTLQLETVNNRYFTADAPMALRLVPVMTLETELDLEMAISNVLSRNRERIEAVLTEHPPAAPAVVTPQPTIGEPGEFLGDPSSSDPAVPVDDAVRADFVVDAREFLPGGSEFGQGMSDVRTDLQVDKSGEPAPVQATPESQFRGAEFDMNASGEFKADVDEDRQTNPSAEVQVRDYLLANATELEEGADLDLASNPQMEVPSDMQECSSCGEPYRVDEQRAQQDKRLLTYCPRCLNLPA